MYLTTKDIKEEFIRLYNAKQFNARGMIEVHGVSFIADKPTIFGEVNEEYIQMELDWYLSQSLNVYDIKKPPSIWMQVSDNYGNINSNYGYLVFNEKNGEQFRNVIRTLRKRPDSKQAIMIYTRPSMHKEAYTDGMKDFICTNAVNYNQDIYDNTKINATVQMRSNDIVYGYKNDYAWQKYLLDRVCDELGKTPGKIIWQVASLHMYERHFKLIGEENENNK